MFKRKVIRFIEEKRMFSSSDKVLVALSGGADSVALLRVLLEAGYPCVAAHCNFHLRGEESDRDETFVRRLCDSLKVPLHVTHFDTATYAEEKGISIEMAARELRYAWFEEVRRQENARVIAVAHHRDDAVETFLLNLVRGTGINGLKGMMAVNGAVVRPLLGVSREEILDYLQHLAQDYVTDSTNLADEYTRNKLRLNVIPQLEEINPSVADSIMETARRLADVETVYRKAMEEACERVRISEHEFSIVQLQKEVAPQSVLFELLHPYGFNASQLKDIYRSLEAESGRLFYSDAYVLLRNRDTLQLKRREELVEHAVPVLHQRIVERDASFVLSKDPKIACLDADKLKGELTLRKWKSGDKFVPFGMKGFKKVRDYLRDRKFSLFEKENQYVVCRGEDIVWLVNERTDNRYRVTDETKRVMMLWV
ncbi:tRNA lysidine(34) synthetase TilS [uncultured Bacteroides sp.]|uniref:tRNA lysidine(34) synthetase TilS n=1 Tax=uncultured Bacteroides sp. TaxID=162156 RepID=UPI00260C0625|nr:tRNA lysidine(34) synthetase TilS [uncultured Bacteroides sp.]